MYNKKLFLLKIKHFNKLGIYNMIIFIYKNDNNFIRLKNVIVN